MIEEFQVTELEQRLEMKGEEWNLDTVKCRLDPHNCGGVTQEF